MSSLQLARLFISHVVWKVNNWCSFRSRELCIYTIRKHIYSNTLCLSTALLGFSPAFFYFAPLLWSSERHSWNLFVRLENEHTPKQQSVGGICTNSAKRKLIRWFLGIAHIKFFHFLQCSRGFAFLGFGLKYTAHFVRRIQVQAIADFSSEPLIFMNEIKIKINT